MTPLQQNASLVVQRLDRASDIASSAGLPYKCLVFPATGGVQAIDAAGTVLPLVGPSGSLVPSADDVDNLGSLTLRWLGGYFGTDGVMTPSLSARTGGVKLTVATLTATALAVNHLVFSSSATGFSPGISSASSTDTNVGLAFAPQGTGSLAFNGPSVVAPPVAASGTQTALKVTSAPNTGQTAGVNAPAVDLNLSASVQFATGAMTLLTAIRTLAPTYAFVAASTVTRAATLYIDTAPQAGANATLTNSYAILVDSGTVRFDDQLSLGGNVSLSGAAPTITATTADQGITLTPSGIGAVALQGSGGANIVAVDTTGGVSRLGFFNVTPLIRQTVNDCVVAADGTSAGTQLNALLASLRLFGLLT